MRREGAEDTLVTAMMYGEEVVYMKHYYLSLVQEFMDNLYGVKHPSCVGVSDSFNIPSKGFGGCMKTTFDYVKEHGLAIETFIGVWKAHYI